MLEVMRKSLQEHMQGQKKDTQLSAILRQSPHSMSSGKACK